MANTTTITLQGTIAGTIWMPAATCAKHFKVVDKPGPWGDFHYSDGSRPTIREMVLKATNDGDFQSCSIIDATVTVERRTAGRNGETVRRRHFDIRQFPSVSDCVVELESDEYFAGLDCFGED